MATQTQDCYIVVGERGRSAQLVSIGRSNHVARVKRGHCAVAYNNECERLAPRGVLQQAQANIAATVFPVHCSRLLAEVNERTCVELRWFRFVRD